MVKFWSQIYSQWKPTNKIFFWLGVFGIILTFIGGGVYYKKNIIKIENSNLENVPICQDCTNVSFTFNSIPPKDDMSSDFYKIDISINLQQGFRRKSNLFYFKFIMPDDQEAFLKEVKYNETYIIGKCNEEETHCIIYNKYRMPNLINNDVCWIFLTRLGHDIPTDNFTLGPKFFKEPNLCFEDLK